MKKNKKWSLKGVEPINNVTPTEKFIISKYPNVSKVEVDVYSKRLFELFELLVEIDKNIQTKDVDQIKLESKV